MQHLLVSLEREKDEFKLSIRLKVCEIFLLCLEKKNKFSFEISMQKILKFRQNCTHKKKAWKILKLLDLNYRCFTLIRLPDAPCRVCLQAFN